MSPEPPAALGVGTRIGPYEIVGWLGAGGMGDVYRARDTRLARDVAMKLIAGPQAADPGRVRRFEQEARAAGQINHPNILAVYDVGVHDGVPFIVSELLEGESLRSRLQKAPIPLRKAVEYARQAAEALAAAHDKGVVHRDIKPDNLFLTADGRLKVLDFGIAKLRASDDGPERTGLPTDTAEGTVLGTAAYMSPEQVRGEAVDARSDIFSLGAVLYEMMSGRAAFARPTAAETMTAVLNEDPPVTTRMDVPSALVRIVVRCLEKARDARFQSARDLAFGLDVLSGTQPVSAVTAGPVRRRGLAVALILVALGVVAALAFWLKPQSAPRDDQDVLANATYTPFTDWDGSELDAAISPDGKFVAFLADRSGPFHVWLKQVGPGGFRDLTPDAGDLQNPGPIRSLGFSGDGAQVWVNGTIGERARRLSLVPITGGAPQPFLAEYAVNVAWSRDGKRLVYLTLKGDPLRVAEANGDHENEILPAHPGDHNHFPAFSPDDRWIYYTHCAQSLADCDIWRIPSAGGTSELVIERGADVRYLTPITDRTVLFVAPDDDGSGPWLWALDVERKVARRISTGLARYLSVAATADGRRLVATEAKSTAGIWSLPIADRIVEEREVTPVPLPTARALAPRFGGDAMFYLSSTGGGDGLWRAQGGSSGEIRMGAGGSLVGAPAVSPAGDRIAVVHRVSGKGRITIVSADGADPRELTGLVDVHGTPAWSPDGKWIVTGGRDAQGLGLFEIPAEGGAAIRLVTGAAADPVWSREGPLIAYLGGPGPGQPLLAIRPDKTLVPLPDIKVRSGGRGRVRFLPDGTGLVYIQGEIGTQDFWLLDLRTMASRQLSRLSNPGTITTFDITPDGKRIVFDRVRERGDVVLIDLARR